MNSKAILKFGNVYIGAAVATVGKTESEGPIGDYFDAIDTDEYFGKKDFEEAEAEMVRRNLNLLLGKAGKSFADTDLLIGGDLLNQCTATAFAAAESGVPYLGLYGACSTFIESVICGSVFIGSGRCDSAICFASSHFCSAERQYRFPLEYGSLRTPTSQRTVTGTGALLLGNQGSIRIESGMIGRIINKGVTDANNMGAAMACAAVDTIKRYFAATGKTQSDFDLIVTGDLGFEGNDIAKDMFALEGIDIGNNFGDCGMMIYDRERQDVHSGGSGCGCIASVFSGYLYKLMCENRLKNVLAVATGALLNTNSALRGHSIPAVAHAVHFSRG